MRTRTCRIMKRENQNYVVACVLAFTVSVEFNEVEGKTYFVRYLMFIYDLGSYRLDFVVSKKNNGTFQDEASKYLNQLPTEIRNADNLSAFCSALRKHLFARINEQ